MGINESKEGKIPNEDLTQGSVPSTPILTPKGLRKEIFSDVDPRSPSVNIARTPIQFAVQDSLENELEEAPVNKILDIDPRSPSTQFQRTPIIVKEEKVPGKLHNKNFDNVIRSTPVSTGRRTIVPPRLLKSSPLTITNANKRKSFVGLLETNIDFTETDLDTVIQSKSLTSLSISVDKNVIDVVETKNYDPRSPSIDFLRTPIQVVKKIGEVELNTSCEVLAPQEEVENVIFSCENLLKIVETVPEININEVNTQKVENEAQNKVICTENLVVCETNELDHAQTNELDEAQTNEQKDAKTNATPTEIKQETTEITLNKTFELPTPTETSEIIQKPNKTPSKTPQKTKINLTADVRDFDKKLTTLIYEDQVVLTPKTKMAALKNEKQRSRTPLGDRNVVEGPKKSASKLKVSDKPRKSDYAVSKIPVFREKQSKLKIQCENTPPRSMDQKNSARKGRTRRPLWDTEKTLIL